MSIRNRADTGSVRDRSADTGRGRRAFAAIGLLLAVAAVAAIALTGSPESAHACLLPGIPC